MKKEKNKETKMKRNANKAEGKIPFVFFCASTHTLNYDRHFLFFPQPNLPEFEKKKRLKENETSLTEFRQ